MDDSCNKRLLARIFDYFERYRLGVISADDMISNIYGNLTALEGTNQKFTDEFEGFLGEVDFIKHTKESSKVGNFVLEEVNIFENYLRQYFQYSKE